MVEGEPQHSAGTHGSGRRGRASRPARDRTRVAGAAALIAAASLGVTGTALAASPSTGPPSATTPSKTTPSTTTPTTTTPVTTKPLPAIQRRTGTAFVPAVGDWEGTADGFPASFELVYDPKLNPPSGILRYGLLDIVTLRPSSCPSTTSRYGEQIFDGHNPSELQAGGSLALTEFGLGGGLTGARAATLSASLPSPACPGRLTWRMHPAERTAVPDGTWTAHFPGRQTERFTVQAGGRLATGLVLPRALVACNGVSGAIDLFIGARGTVVYDGADVRAVLRFSGRAATGTLNSGGRGCPNGPLRFTASAPRR